MKVITWNLLRILLAVYWFAFSIGPEKHQKKTHVTHVMNRKNASKMLVKSQ